MTRSLLQNVYLFKSMQPEQLDKIAEVVYLETFTSRQDIFSQHDKAFAFYLIKYGSVRIHQQTKSGEKIEIATLGTGNHFGEMALLDHAIRSGTATAVENTELIIVPYDKIAVLLKADLSIAAEFYKEMAHFLAGRLRITTNDLSFARERNMSHF